VASASEGVWEPEVGYEWIAPGSKDKANHLIAGKLEGTWEPRC
jgi:hypothetical protein